MLIFGTRSYLQRLAMITLVCGFCGNPAAHALRRRVTKFTLFFVPLFPISSKYSTQCTFCGGEHGLPKDQAEQLRAQAAAGAQQNPFAAQAQNQPQAQPFGDGRPQNPYQN